MGSSMPSQFKIKPPHLQHDGGGHLPMSFDCVLAAWRLHEAELRNYLLHRLGDSYAADDLLQEEFIKSLRQGQGFCEIDNPRAWLFQVARNALTDQARSGKTYVELPDDLAAPEEEGRAPVDELDACLLRNLSEIPSEDRDIIEQCDLQGVKQQAFAQAHGLSLSAAKSRLQRARQRLREALTRNNQKQNNKTDQENSHV